MNPARQQVQEYIIESIAAILPNSKHNREIYNNFFAKMSDTQFEAMMERMERTGEAFPFYHPNFTGDLIDVEHVVKLIEKEGGTIMEHIWITDPDTGTRYKTPIKYPVIMLPLRIQQQKLGKKLSVPKDNRHIDDLTNQPTSESKGAGVSYPEIQVLYAMGLDKTLEELLKVRGGDEEAFRAYNNEIIATGAVNIGTISSNRTKVKSTKTVSAVLNAMYLSNKL